VATDAQHPRLQAELSAVATTKRGGLAGAIAARARSSEHVYVLAKGADAVANAMSAISRARTFLEMRAPLH
jgi:stage V sporulation protein SpoVS